jgi:ferric-dicitrate binding protein FerR (iron transport regulator)
MSFKDLIVGDHRNPREEIVAIFGDQQGADAPEAIDRATSWANGVLHTAGIPVNKQVEAIAEIRRAEPRLGLKSATHLASLLEK